MRVDILPQKLTDREVERLCRDAALKWLLIQQHQVVPTGMPRAELFLAMERDIADAFYGRSRDDVMRLFDRVRLRMRRRGDLYYSGLGWYHPEVWELRRERQRLRKLNHVWKRAQQDLERDLGPAVLAASEGEWMDIVQTFRTKYRAIINMGPEGYAKVGAADSDLAVLVYAMEDE